MTTGFEEAKQNVIETLDDLDEDDDFVFVSSETVDDSGDELSIQTHVGSSDSNVPYVNLVGMQILMMHRHFDNYPLAQAAQDSLEAAQLMARGGTIEEN